MVTVTVTNPQQHGEGRSSYITYLIQIKHSTNNTLTRRRYSEFQWLYNRLVSVERPGAIVLSIPHRRAFLKSSASSVGENTNNANMKVTDELVVERQGHLCTFLEEVVSHEEVKDAPSLELFLGDKFGEEFEFGKKELEKRNDFYVLDEEDEEDDIDDTTGDEGLSENASNQWKIDDENNEEGEKGSDNIGSDYGMDDNGEDDEYNESESMSLTSSIITSTPFTTPSNTPTNSNNNNNTQTAKGKVRNLFARAQTSFSILRGNSELMSTPDEPHVERITRYVSSLETYVKSISNSLNQLLKVQEDHSRCMKDMSNTLLDWSKLGTLVPNTKNNNTQTKPNNKEEDKTGGVSEASSVLLANLSDVTSATSRHLLRNQHHSYEHKLLPRLYHLSRTIDAIRVALNKRKECQLTVTTRWNQISSRTQSLDKLSYGNKKKKNAKNIESMSLQIRKLKREASHSELILNVTTKRLLRESNRVGVWLEKEVENVGRIWKECEVEFVGLVLGTWRDWEDKNRIVGRVRREEKEEGFSAADHDDDDDEWDLDDDEEEEEEEDKFAGDEQKKKVDQDVNLLLDLDVDPVVTS